VLLAGGILVQPVGLSGFPDRLLRRLAVGIDDVERAAFEGDDRAPESCRWSVSGWFGMMIDFQTRTLSFSNCGSRRVADACAC
jgi:hypothetical protein